MASRPAALPLKEHCFNFTVPDGTASVDEIIDGLEDVMWSEGVLFLQHLGASKFLVAARSVSQATKLMVNQGFKLQGHKVEVEAVGAPSVQVSVFRLPPYVPDDAVIPALQPYGKVKGITFVTLQRHQSTYTGTRIVRIEMAKPAPNFLSIQGHRVMLEYRGMRRIVLMLTLLSPSAPGRICPTGGVHHDAVRNRHELVNHTCDLPKFPSFLDVPLDGHLFASQTSSPNELLPFPSPFKSNLLSYYPLWACEQHPWHDASCATFLRSADCADADPSFIFCARPYLPYRRRPP
ncbi:hypothetical protein MTO96_022031 [Rhipicephalus appendiculatus]